MNLPLFIARKIYTDKGDRHKVSRPVMHIATAGVAIGLAVMIITVSVVFGFKHTIRDKVIGFGSHVLVDNLLGYSSACNISDSTVQALTALNGVEHVQRYANVQGILKTDSDFLGIVFKGIGEDYRMQFLKQHLIEGKADGFSSKESTNGLLISKLTADKLRLKTGDRVFAYFISDDGVKARRFTVTGIYQTNLTQYDQNFCFTDIYTTRRINAWQDTDLYSGAEITVKDFEQLNTTTISIIQTLKDVNINITEPEQQLQAKPVQEANPQIFNWLELLDLNVWIILVLMVCVAGFTMISGLLIIILERTQMIGTLKALGARNTTVRRTFLWFATFIISQGLIAGNIIGIGIVVAQQHFGLIKLDPATYYVHEAPMELNIPVIIIINVATLLISVFVLIAPSYLISFIHPARSMKYE
ncbi:MAG: ABC transporter permease [Prevotella sp.]|nr:ABC transporter permease [Prevotella sp.]